MAYGPNISVGLRLEPAGLGREVNCGGEIEARRAVLLLLVPPFRPLVLQVPPYGVLILIQSPDRPAR